MIVEPQSLPLANGITGYFSIDQIRVTTRFLPSYKHIADICRVDEPRRPYINLGCCCMDGVAALSIRDNSIKEGSTKIWA